ncbi:unnamed protein product [Lactuca saligna]|uniref:Uncharacterized protein n=1 Tax=Lactuca saligna TaxID=75948 RepID=A0AA36DXV8_LACSI|nr:unnamed protein product [Lactuca saligna]
MEDERRFEETLQGITFKDRPLEINIARFARKLIDSKEAKFMMNQNQHRRPQECRWNGKDNRSFAEVVRGRNKLGRPTAYQTQEHISPIKIMDDSPLRGWLSSKLTLIGETHSFDHLEKAPLAFKNCDGELSELTVEINGKTIKIRIDEVDLDWTPFKQYEQSMEDTFSLDEGEDEVEDMDGTDDEDHVSDTFPMQYERKEPEEGGIRDEDGTELNSYINVAGKHSNSVKAPSSADMVAVETDGGSETDSHRESQRTQINANINEGSVNETPNEEAVNAALSQNLKSNYLGHMDSSNGPLNMLPISGCFGPFPNNMVRSESFSGRINNNFKGSCDKRRRILTPIPESFMENQMASSNQPSIDLNQVLLPS